MEKPRNARGHFIKGAESTTKSKSERVSAPVESKRSHAKKNMETHIYTSVCYIDFEIMAANKPDSFALVGISDLVEDALKKFIPGKGCKITDASVSMLYKEPEVKI